jgi:hypothetical protein
VTAPLTPMDCDLQDFPRMMIDIPRLFSSEFDATDNDSAWRFGVTLWLKSFHQVPAASLPDDDAVLARLCGLGRDVRTWRQCRAVALRGWVKCDDGLLYHPVVAEVALEAWLEKLTQRLSSGAGNAARWGSEFDPEPIRAEIGVAATLLAGLNPKSKALSKQQAALALRKSRRDTPTEVPSGHPEHPDGTAKPIPSGSQGKGREGIEDTEPDGSGADAPPGPSDDDEGLDPLADLRAMPTAKGSWRLAVKVLVEQGRMTDPKARAFIGKLKAGGLTDDELWQISEAAFGEQTEDPQAYLVKAARGTIERRNAAPPAYGPRLRNPPEMQQRAWMRDWTSGEFEWKEADRGPPPGQPGCQVSAEIQREHGVEPAKPQPVRGAA